VNFPNFLQWWLKKIAIWAEESSELEQAKLGLSQCHCSQRQQLEKLFDKSET
jgi:hypothetical protein